MQPDRAATLLAESIIDGCQGQGAITPITALISTATVMAMCLNAEQRLAIADALRAEAAMLDHLGERRALH
jgi:hypothetical protein